MPPHPIRPDIQGLRAVAVGLVFLSHTWPELVPWTFALIFNKTVDADAYTGTETLKKLKSALKRLIPTLSDAGTRDLFNDYTDSVLDAETPGVESPWSDRWVREWPM